jgi:hypothetical protein
MKSFAPTIIALTMYATNAFGQEAAPENKSVELFQNCAEIAVGKTAEAQAQIDPQTQTGGSSLYIDESVVDQNGTRLESDGEGNVVASGPGAETALREYNVCIKAFTI